MCACVRAHPCVCAYVYAEYVLACILVWVRACFLVCVGACVSACFLTLELAPAPRRLWFRVVSRLSFSPRLAVGSDDICLLNSLDITLSEAE